jgi:Ca-activated chloride channel family protein
MHIRIQQALFGGLVATVALSLGAQQEFAIRADVNLVQLPAKVTDSKGHAVLGLDKNAFQLFVDNVPQPISIFQGEDAAVTAGIVVDNSASMSPKREQVIAAALAFARASNPRDEMFVLHFSDRARFGLPAGTQFTERIPELESAIAAFDLGGTTALYDALLMAQSQLRSAGYPRKVLLTITDGGDNSSHATLNEVLNSATKTGTVVYPIGIFNEEDRDRNPQVLSKIAQQTGGEAFFPEHLADVTKTCVGIAETIRKQYTVGFHGADDGHFHSVRLTAKDPKYGALRVETRAGYIAGAVSNTGSQGWPAASRTP